MAESVYKFIELVGTSDESWEKAAIAAVEQASKTLRDLRIAEVVEQDMQIDNGKVINIEGDPDHPVNRGAACAKGASMRQLAADNPRRLSKVLYRAPGASGWEEKRWDWAIDRLAQLIKKTRDANWVAKDGNYTVNRTEAVASIGGAALDNEECYLITKMSRALGLVYLEHQARI